jgi:hypothetical protein
MWRSKKHQKLCIILAYIDHVCSILLTKNRCSNSISNMDKHMHNNGQTCWYYMILYYIYVYIWPHEKCLINQKWILSLGKMLRNASLHNTITDTFWIMSHSFGDVIHHNNNTNNKYHNNNNRYLYIYVIIYICYYNNIGGYMQLRYRHFPGWDLDVGI